MFSGVLIKLEMEREPQNNKKKLIIERIIYEAHKESFCVCVLFGIPTTLHHVLWSNIVAKYDDDTD